MRNDGAQGCDRPWALPVAVIAAAFIVATAVLLSGDDDHAAERKVVEVPGLLEGLPFSPAVRAGGLLFLSGQIGIRPGTMELVDGGVGAETRQTMENIRTVLEAAGAGFDDLVKCTVFVEDISEWGAVNEVYRAYFEEAPPARAAFGADGLALGAAVEIDCIARDPSDD